MTELEKMYMSAVPNSMSEHASNKFGAKEGGYLHKRNKILGGKSGSLFADSIETPVKDDTVSINKKSQFDVTRDFDENNKYRNNTSTPIPLSG